jgi:uncharacterized protein (TIGR00251 family)
LSTGLDTNPIEIRIKVIPNASHDALCGLLGDRLKLRVSAAPEDGKANKAIEKLLARSVGLKPSQVIICAGHTNPEKTVQIYGISVEILSESLGFDTRLITLNQGAKR